MLHKIKLGLIEAWNKIVGLLKKGFRYARFKLTTIHHKEYVCHCQGDCNRIPRAPLFIDGKPYEVEHAIEVFDNIRELKQSERTRNATEEELERFRWAIESLGQEVIVKVPKNLEEDA